MKKNIIIICLALLSSMNINGQELYENIYQWKIPGGNYIDPTSFFSLHGYVNAVFGSESKEWTLGHMNGMGMPGQVLIPNTNKNSFQTDEALWISSEISEKTSLLMEIHLVTDPSGKGAAGPGGLTFVLTEANVKFKLFKNLANVSVGTFWNPFGIHNNDWLGAQNLFTIIPYASSAYPTHYNEKGIRIDGYFGQKKKVGVNYVVSIGNGYNAWDISGYQAVDLNDNQTISARVSVFPYLKDKLNVGFSFAQGSLMDGDTAISDSFALHYDNAFQSMGMDLIFKWQNLKLRSYLISTARTYKSDNLSINTANFGFMSELSYELMLKKMKGLKSVVPKIRYDYGSIGLFHLMNPGEDVFTSISFGCNIHLNESFYISADYNLLTESANKLDNDRLIIRVSANF